MSNPRVLFMDDDPSRAKIFRRHFPFATFAATAAECIERLASGPWDFLFADHDLEGQHQCSYDPNCGMAVVRWIEANKPVIGRVWVHTHNGPAGREMAERLTRAGYAVEQRSFMFIDFEELGERMERMAT